MDLIYKVTAYETIDDVYDFFSGRLVNENKGFFFETKDRPGLEAEDSIYYFFKNHLVAKAIFDDGVKDFSKEGKVGYKLRDIKLYSSKEKINHKIIDNNICYVEIPEQKAEIERVVENAIVMQMLKANEIDNDEDEESYPEGKYFFRVHKSIERSPELVKRAKEKRLKDTGKLACEVCRMDFKSTYGELGDGFIEAHHSIPVAEMKPNHNSKSKDLNLVCSNCHRMLHRGKSLLTVDDLRKILK